MVEAKFAYSHDGDAVCCTLENTFIRMEQFTLACLLKSASRNLSMIVPISLQLKSLYLRIFQRFFFLEYENHEQAAEAVKTSNGYQLDKTHVFAVNFFTDIEK